MTRLVEVSAGALSGVRDDVAAVRESVEGALGPLRGRARGLGVPTAGFDDALAVADRLSTSVLPVVDVHLERARALEALRYGGPTGGPIPVVDAEPLPMVPGFTQTALADGGTGLAWGPTTDAEVDADAEEAEDSGGIGGWFGDRWDDVSGAAADAGEWVGDRAGQAWDAVTEAGAEIGDWRESVTADLGGWIDRNLDGVRDVIGRYVAVFRFLADLCRVVGWVLVVVGAVLTIVLAVVGGLGGFAAGTFLGGPAGIPAGVAGALAGATLGLKVLGVGFTLVSVGDFLDVVADWGEGKIDGQDLVKKGALELGLALTSLLGVGVIGKILQKTADHLPASWRSRIEEWLDRLRKDDEPPPPPRTFTSPDPLVADVANEVERALPGRIRDVNTRVPMTNGRLREVDIDLGDVVVQVKSDNARGLTGQMQRTAATTGKTVIGYAPDIPHGAWLNAKRQGLLIARTPEELIQMLKDLE